MNRFLSFCIEVLAFAGIYICLKKGFYLALIPNILSGVWGYIQIAHPESRLAKLLGFELSPVPVTGMMRSDYTLKLSLFSSKCMLLLAFIWSLFYFLGIDPESHPVLMGIFALGIPLFFTMAFAVVLFQMLLYLYIFLTGRDSEFKVE